MDDILRSGHESIVHDILKRTQKRREQNNRTKYSEEFKKQVVALHQNGKPYRQLAIEYGVNINTIAEWVRKYSEIKMRMTLL
ncbi:MAG: transposase [Firmicutes bacterium]|nr:transposase [Bacillota bacterium]